jgi:hypothetical protein
MPPTIPHARRVRDAILQPHATASDAARWLSPVILGAEWPAWCATLDHLRAFARRAARGGHWWAPVDHPRAAARGRPRAIRLGRRGGPGLG